jgi:hypothetical protein
MHHPWQSQGIADQHRGDLAADATAERRGHTAPEPRERAACDPSTLRRGPGREVRLLTMREAAGELHVPESWLRREVTARAVPFTRLGKHVGFTAEQLRAIGRT